LTEMFILLRDDLEQLIMLVLALECINKQVIRSQQFQVFKMNTLYSPLSDSSGLLTTYKHIRPEDQ